jgi:S-adenosylmethionine decarboxylase
MTDKVERNLSRHYLGTLITDTPKALFEGEACLEELRSILDKLDVVNLGDQLHIFPNKSFTLLIALSESHISIHTWPERHTVQLDVFLCNYMNDNSHKCKVIYDEIVAYFKPTETDTTIIERP